MKQAPSKLAASVLTSFALSGCASFGTIKTLEPEPRTPPMVEALPDDFSGGSETSAYTPARWWTVYDDAVLDALVATSQAQNFDIQEATARLAQANAQARQAAAGSKPSLTGTGSANYSDSPLAGSGFGSFGREDGVDGGAVPDAEPGRLQIETVSLSLGAAYELDLFGQALNNTAAARGDAAAARYDLESLRLSAANETIRSYLNIVDARYQIELQRDTAALIEERLRLTEARFARGLAESFELYQLDQDLRNIQAGIPVREAALQQTRNQLALVLGEYSPAIRARLETELSPRISLDPVSPDLPASLLEQRPDIRAAWARLEAARRRIGARKAERYPALSLSASIGSQGADFIDAVDVLNNWLLSLATNLTAPLLDGGRREAGVDAAEAVYAERSATYAETVVRAFGEVETALSDLRLQMDRYRLVFGQLDATRNTLNTQRQRFERGTGSYVSVLDARRAVLQTEGALSTAARDLALARLGIHRALGGDWDLPRASDPVATPAP
ncbi:MAG: TolC family protein [Pseudomonadota bacterium]